MGLNLCSRGFIGRCDECGTVVETDYISPMRSTTYLRDIGWSRIGYRNRKYKWACPTCKPRRDAA